MLDPTTLSDEEILRYAEVETLDPFAQELARRYAEVLEEVAVVREDGSLCLREEEVYPLWDAKEELKYVAEHHADKDNPEDVERTFEAVTEALKLLNEALG